jgi:hypothetical protein
MKNINYTFFEEFKRLDKLCGDLYQQPRGVTLYIDEMQSTYEKGCQKIPGWYSDLKQLKHLRHIRNYLAHEEDAFSEDLCEQEDIDWVRSFYRRILNQTDPLALLYKQQQSKRCMKPMQEPLQKKPSYSSQSSYRNQEFHYGCLAFAFIVIFVFIYFMKTM